MGLSSWEQPIEQKLRAGLHVIIRAATATDVDRAVDRLKRHFPERAELIHNGGLLGSRPTSTEERQAYSFTVPENWDTWMNKWKEEH